MGETAAAVRHDNLEAVLRPSGLLATASQGPRLTVSSLTVLVQPLEVGAFDSTATRTPLPPVSETSNTENKGKNKRNSTVTS